MFQLNYCRKLLLTLPILLMVSCLHNPYDITEYKKPPRFKPISSEQLSSEMWQLAFYMGQLENTLHEDKHSQQQITEISSHLSKMETVVQKLKTKDLKHPLLGYHLDRFSKDVTDAKNAANANPPDLELASKVSSACHYCHESK